MTQPQRIYRTADGVVGGVCGGLARWLDMDPALVRLVVILLAVVSGGLVVVAYLAAWIILPKEELRANTVDVDPAAFHSERSGQVATAAPSASSVPPAPPVPPVPPAGMPASPAAPFVPVPNGQPAGGSAATMGLRASMPSGAAGAVPSWQAAPGQTASGQAAQGQGTSGGSSAQGSRPAYVGLAIGIVFIVVGAAALLSLVLGTSSVLQFWPLAVVAAGIVRIVIPCKDGTRMVSTWLGALLVLSGLIALATTLDIYTVDTDVWLSRASPFLLMAGGLFVMARATDSQILAIMAAVALALFCLVGSYFGFQESQLDYRNVHLPFDREYILDWDLDEDAGMDEDTGWDADEDPDWGWNMDEPGPGSPDTEWDPEWDTREAPVWGFGWGGTGAQDGQAPRPEGVPQWLGERW